MIKKIKKLFKKMGHVYMDGATQLYGPMIRYNVNPFM